VSYMPHLHYCAWCHADLGAENGDGTCGDCDAKLVECGECGELRMLGQRCGVCAEYAAVEVSGFTLSSNADRTMTREEYYGTLRRVKLHQHLLGG